MNLHLHDFLTQVHAVVRPETYLEVGVQHGTSLIRAAGAQRAIGIDPEPLVRPYGNMAVYKMTADDYFEKANDAGDHPPIDFGFIDGLHHFEAALRDFLNIERHVHSKSVVIFDDVLPRNQEEAHRVQCPGDWTGDVWKVSHLLLKYRSELTIREVNTGPTGTLMVYGFPGRPGHVPRPIYRHVKEYMNLTEVPQATLDRAYAIEPEQALKDLADFLA